ncbi:MAG: PKD domain-containing protein [Bacteroidota bacterium]
MQKCLLLVILAFIATFRGDAQCNADFSYSIDSNTGEVQFTNLSTLANVNQAVTYTWYSNPAIVLSNDTNPVIHLKPGLQSICLAIANAGCNDTFCTTINMPPVHCRATFQYSLDFTMDTVTFTNNSSGLNLNYYWSFGDGNYSTEQHPKHRFATNGWYYVCLNIVNTDTTCTDVTCEFVRINRNSPSPCVGDFSFETDTADSYNVQFTNTTLGDTGITYFWLFGDTVTSTLKDPTHRFDTIGNYTVCLLVSGPNCADSICKIVEIINIIPFCKADFSYALFPDSGNNATRIAVFTNKSVGPNLTYEWRFNDVNPTAEVSPVHYFGVNGTYNVCLIVRSGVLCTDTLCKQISIETGLPEFNSLSGVTVYPIPARNVLHITFNKPIASLVTLKLFDVLGNDKTISLQKGIDNIEVGITDLPAGFYILELKTDTEVKTIRIMK